MGGVERGGQTSPSEQVRAADLSGQVWAASRVGGAWRRPPGGAAPLPAVRSWPSRALSRPQSRPGAQDAVPPLHAPGEYPPRGKGPGRGDLEGESRPCCTHVPCRDASTPPPPRPSPRRLTLPGPRTPMRCRARARERLVADTTFGPPPGALPGRDLATENFTSAPHEPVFPSSRRTPGGHSTKQTTKKLL